MIEKNTIRVICDKQQSVGVLVLVKLLFQIPLLSFPILFSCNVACFTIFAGWFLLKLSKLTKLMKKKLTKA
jgi:hypothetical protein